MYDVKETITNEQDMKIERKCRIDLEQRMTPQPASISASHPEDLPVLTGFFRFVISAACNCL